MHTQSLPNVHVKKDTIIPPKENAKVRVSIRDQCLKRMPCFLAIDSKLAKKTKASLLTHCVEFENGETDVEVHNAGGDPLKFKTGSIIAHVEKVSAETLPEPCCVVNVCLDNRDSKEKEENKGAINIEETELNNENNASGDLQTCADKDNEVKEKEYESPGNLPEVVKEKYWEMKLVTGSLNVGSTLTDEQWSKALVLLQRYNETFAFDKKHLGRTNLCEVKINTGNKPPFNLPPYRLPFFMRQEINRQIKEMLDMGVIRESKSPYSSPVLLVKKKDGSWRLVVDLRRLNQDVEAEVYPLPNLEDVMLILTEAKYFSILDMNSGFWQMEIAEE
ncbi:Transposon Ty3-G Gag-Pol polyprotein-like protein, partial [Dinothrombium tinctorium]